MEENFTVPITRPQSFQSPPPQPQKQEVTYPTEVIELPSQGHFYPLEHPLSSGKLELKMMTAKEEDILMSQNLIKKGIVLDKLLETLIVDKNIKLDDLLLADKNAILVAARRLAYGDGYGPVEVTCPKCREKNQVTFNLGEIKNEEFDFDKYTRGENSFEFVLPYSKKTIQYKILTHKDEQQIENELKANNKILKGSSSNEVTARLRSMIISVDGNSDRNYVKKYVETEMVSRDALSLRQYIKKNIPDVDLNFNFTCGDCSHEERLGVPLTVQFFWPDTGR
jgi:phage FluMu protein Com